MKLRKRFEELFAVQMSTEVSSILFGFLRELKPELTISLQLGGGSTRFQIVEKVARKSRWRDLALVIQLPSRRS
jgi:hypothetical protein